MQFWKWVFGKGRKGELVGTATQEPSTTSTDEKIKEDPYKEMRDRVDQVIGWFEEVAGESGGIVITDHNLGLGSRLNDRMLTFPKGALKVMTEGGQPVGIHAGRWHLYIENFPESIIDIEPLPSYYPLLDKFHEARELIWEFLDTYRPMLVRLGVVSKPPYRFMKVRDRFVPIVKLFDDLTWVDLGYQGPLVTISDFGDGRGLDKTVSLIPDSLTIYDASDLLQEELVKFMTETIHAFPPEEMKDLVNGYEEVFALLGLKPTMPQVWKIEQSSMDQAIKGAIRACIDQEDRDGLWEICVKNGIVKEHDHTKENVDKLFHLIKMMF